MQIMKSVSFKNLVLLIIVKLWVRTSTQMVWNIILVRKVRLENMCRVGFDAAAEEVIVG